MRLYEELSQSEKDRLSDACTNSAIAGLGYMDPRSLYNSIAFGGYGEPAFAQTVKELTELPDRFTADVTRRLREIGDDVRTQAGH